MSRGAAAIVADFRRAIALLAEIDDAGATRTAQALDRWLAGAAFDDAAGLPPGWRRHLQQTVRDAALAALVALHGDLGDRALAKLLVAGVTRMRRRKGVRPDGALGHFADLVRAECFLSERGWRRLVSQTRGQRNHRNGHYGVSRSEQ
jgi:hypothetical protein